MAHRGERVIGRKAIAQGMSDVLRCPVCSCAHFLCTLRMRPRVQRAPGIPCALCLERARKFLAKLGRIASRERETVSAVIARSSCDEAIHPFFTPRHGLLRFARNDGAGSLKCEVKLGSPAQHLAGSVHTTCQRVLNSLTAFASHCAQQTGRRAFGAVHAANSAGKDKCIFSDCSRWW
jgi:hypothetical protein